MLLGKKKKKLTRCSMTGVDVILDHIGASYFKQNLESLNFDGRLLVIGTMGGSVTEVDLRALISKRITVQGMTLFTGVSTIVLE